MHRFILGISLGLFLLINNSHSNSYTNLDNMSYSQRGKIFRSNVYVSKIASYIALIGTGLSVFGLLIENEQIDNSGKIVFAVGLPAHGIGTLGMRRVSSPRSLITPNGWKWYGIALIFAISYLGITQYSDDPHPAVVYGSLVATGATGLISWMNFTRYRERLVKIHSEYCLHLRPVLQWSKNPNNKNLGLALALNF